MFFIVNGHGGNNGAASVMQELIARLPGLQVRWYNWWAGPRSMGYVREQDADASHASWRGNARGRSRALVGAPLGEARDREGIAPAGRAPQLRWIKAARAGP